MTARPDKRFPFRLHTMILFGCALSLASCNGSCKNGSQPIINNALTLTVADAFGSSASNVLYTSVKICDANSNCQTIDNVQVDTGSGGLRLFKTALPPGAPVTPVLSGQSPIGECQTFAMGSAWGQVETTFLVLASEPAINIPIQVIDASFGKQPPPSPCDIGNWNGPSEIHANGILGIDVGVPDSGVYFTCQNNACSPLTPQAPQRVTNPVVQLPVDNNGVIVNLPNVPDNGQATAAGTLVLGIHTQLDNDPDTYSPNPKLTVTLNATDPLIASTTTTDGQTYFEFAPDTGSNGFFFTDANITNCPKILGFLDSPWYCPANPCNLGVQVAGTSGSPWRFQLWIRDQRMLAGTNNLAFNDLGGPSPDPSLFIAGLPFFYGKQVYIGYAGKSSSLGNGPLYAYALR
jgi:Protein of unknown function (DUF3443)